MVVLPELPVIAINWASEIFLVHLDKSFNDFLTFLTLRIFLDFFIFILLSTTAATAPFFNESCTKLWPSFFFPLNAKKISPFEISFVLIETELKLIGFFILNTLRDKCLCQIYL